MQPQIYRSKRSPAILLPLILILGGTSFMFLLRGAWPGLVVNALIILFIAHVYLNTYYTIDGTLLKIRCGVFKQEIPVREITSISRSRNPLSAPALSFDRLSIRFGKHGQVLISPENKDAFIKGLMDIHPAIQHTA